MADMASIKLFHSMLTPVMEAIPQVLEMMEKKADMDRTLTVYKAELVKAKAEVQKVYDEADRRLVDLNGQMTAVLDRKATVADEVSRLDAKLRERMAAIDDTVNSAKYAADAAVIQHNARANEAALRAEAQIKDADAAFAARSAMLEKSIADLEKREAAAIKALDSLRSKLG